MVIEILVIVSLFLWFISLLPFAALPPQLASSSGWLAFISVLLLALFLFIPGLRA